MHPRYPAPNARAVFSEEAKYSRWAYFTKLYAYERIVYYETLAEPLRDRLVEELGVALTPTARTVVEFESQAGHDVVAFLAAFTARMSDELKPYIHFGLTSSDLVDNAHYLAMRTHAKQMRLLVEDLRAALGEWEGMDTVRAGRTHGQIADLTSLGHQFHVHSATLSRIAGHLNILSNDAVLKSPGPTGGSHLVGSFARSIAAQKDWQLVPSTQVIPRDWQVEWASVYLRLACELESLATLVRCGARQEVGELREGASRIGSSSMPTKKNPIDAEKVCGLARVARGYFTTIAENVALWDDRDISNSSVERIVIPDLAAVVEHMTDTMTSVIHNLEVDYRRMHHNAETMHTMTNLLQALAQKHFQIGPVQAGRLMRKVLNPENDSINGPALVDAGFDKEQIYEWERDARLMWEARMSESSRMVVIDPDMGRAPDQSSGFDPGPA